MKCLLCKIICVILLLSLFSIRDENWNLCAEGALTIQQKPAEMVRNWLNMVRGGQLPPPKLLEICDNLYKHMLRPLYSTVVQFPETLQIWKDFHQEIAEALLRAHLRPENGKIIWLERDYLFQILQTLQGPLPGMIYSMKDMTTLNRHSSSWLKENKTITDTKLFALLVLLDAIAETLVKILSTTNDTFRMVLNYVIAWMHAYLESLNNPKKFPKLVAKVGGPASNLFHELSTVFKDALGLYSGFTFSISPLEAAQMIRRMVAYLEHLLIATQDIDHPSPVLDGITELATDILERTATYIEDKWSFKSFEVEITNKLLETLEASAHLKSTVTRLSRRATPDIKTIKLLVAVTRTINWLQKNSDHLREFWEHEYKKIHQPKSKQ